MSLDFVSLLCKNLEYKPQMPLVLNIFVLGNILNLHFSEKMSESSRKFATLQSELTASQNAELHLPTIKNRQLGLQTLKVYALFLMQFISMTHLTVKMCHATEESKA